MSSIPSGLDMRILQLAPPWFTVPPSGYGGTEWVVAQLADGLPAAGHDVTLLASGGSVTRARLVTVFDRPPSERLGEQWPDLLHALTGYRMAADFDLIHDHSGIIGPALGAMLSATGAVPPVVHTLHGPWHDDAAVLYRALGEAAEETLHLVAISHDQAGRAPEGVRVDAVVHNGIPVERFRFRPDRRGTDGYLAFVGRATADKGPDTAVRIARALGRPLRMAVKINEPAEHAYWDEVIVPLLHGADVEVTVNATFAQKAALMEGADALLNPIAWPEPFGLVMAEAMACGTPVVGYAAGAAPEVVEDGRTGFLVPTGDLDALCAAVGRVGEIDALACRRRVETLFSSQSMVDGYLRVYEKIVAERSG